MTTLQSRLDAVTVWRQGALPGTLNDPTKCAGDLSLEPGQLDHKCECELAVYDALEALSVLLKVEMDAVGDYVPGGKARQRDHGVKPPKRLHCRPQTQRLYALLRRMRDEP